MKPHVPNKDGDSAEREPRESFDRSRRGPRTTVAADYSGPSGEQYASWQLRSADGMAAEVARRFLPWISPNMAIVDFGCGGGALLEVLPAARKIGIEPNAAAAALAVSRGIHVVPMSDDLDDDSVDLAISNHALEHVLHPVAELQQLRRILKVGAHLVIIVPVDDWRAQDNGRANDPNHHLYTWTPLLLGNLLSAAGFAVERVELIHRAWPPAHQFLWRILPPSAFDVLAGLAARVQRRRQLIAVARKDIS